MLKTSEPPRRQAAAIFAQRRRLMIEIAMLQKSSRASKFTTNAEQLLTRWWAEASWGARRELLKSADWLLRLERRREPGEPLRA
jgi:hypothetical protein